MHIGKKPGRALSSSLNCIDIYNSEAIRYDHPLTIIVAATGSIKIDDARADHRQAHI
jgi:hypothetical protein